MQSRSPSDELDNRSGAPIDEDMALQRAVWRMERVGWIVLCLVVLLSLAGLFSVGPLSTATAASPDGDLVVDYERFLRNGAATDLQVRVITDDDGDVVIRLGASLMGTFTIETLHPHPKEAGSDRSGLVLTFPPAREGAFAIYLSIRPSSTGLVRGEVSLDDGTTVPLSSFIYP